jgi:hypothetical protein
MSQNVDEFVKEMEEDILDDDQLNDMIKEDIPMEPKQIKKQNVYQEQYRRPQQRRPVEQMQPPRQFEQYQEQPYPIQQERGEKKSYSLDKLKNMINVNKLKLPIFTMVLFVILSLPQVNDILGNYVAILKVGEDGKPSIINLAIKGIVFGVVILVMSQLL